MVFARKINDSLIGLIKQIDKAAAQHGNSRLGACVVFPRDDGTLSDALKALVKKEGIQHTILAIDLSDSIPPQRKLSPEADITVLLYVHYMVQANHAFRAGELKKKDIQKIIADLSKIVPSK
jgi:hypothetical protein